VTRGQLP